MSTAILWLRSDLRITDNPALINAAEHGQLIPVFIQDPAATFESRPGGASSWWLHHSLERLMHAYREKGSNLLLRRGDPRSELAALAAETGASHIYWNRRYEPWHFSADRELEGDLRSRGLEVKSFPSQLLFEPGQIQRGGGGPFRVFTPFWKACLKQGLPETVAPQPQSLPPAPRADGLELAELGLLPNIPWYEGMAQAWTPGEQGALERLEAFADGTVSSYAKTRDTPARDLTSRLSPHLHFGELSPRQVLAGLYALGPAARSDTGVHGYVRQLGWREFAHHLLFHYPETSSQPMNPRFSGFPWRTGYEADLRLWQQGRTGIPLVDAGMRQLWHTGWMHNRVRMVAASFLTKNLLIPWQEGAAWFHDTLVDADPANNIMGWQWVAGSGADAAPYFRIFNPVLQGEKFDPEGIYVKRWVPELTEVPERYMHKPWAAPKDIRRQSSFGEYPEPMVDLKETRERALAAYRRLTD